MIYWLFTDGRQLLTPFLSVLLCIAPVLMIVSASSSGAGIRRTSEDTSSQPAMQRTLKIATYATAMLTAAALFLALLGGQAIQRRQSHASAWIEMIVGAPPGIHAARLFMFAALLGFTLLVTAIALHSLLRDGGWLREKIDRLRSPIVRRGALGSSHFCTLREYRRFRRADEDGLTLLGAYWGENKRRLDVGSGRFCLSGEDIARGILTLGGPGSGKTQGLILPCIADRMLAGHSLIVADPQGEITAHVIQYAAVTRHLVVIHDPTSTAGPRYNLAAEISTVSDARAIADVLVPSAIGENRFWTDSAAALLAACLIRFDTLGDIYNAMNDTKALANALKSKKDDAALLANSFIASVASDAKVASNVIATLATALTGWASTDVRANTATSDFSADLIVKQPTIVLLTCPGRMRAVYASYLGATLRKLMLDLDTIGEQNHGPLPMPVGVILDEFPTLGKLDSLVADVNLVRKRRISILIGAQTKGQFEMIYGREGTQALFTGLATQVVYGGCDADTADFYSKASGVATTDANIDNPNSHLHHRPLLTVDEVITPQVGNCTIFARYVETGFATQAILNARLTRFYEREDWKHRLSGARTNEPLLLERGVYLDEPKHTPPDPPTAEPLAGGPSTIEIASRELMRQIDETSGMKIGMGVKTTRLSAMRQQVKKHEPEITP